MNLIVVSSSSNNSPTEDPRSPTLLRTKNKKSKTIKEKTKEEPCIFVQENSMLDNPPLITANEFIRNFDVSILE